MSKCALQQEREQAKIVDVKKEYNLFLTDST